MKDLYLVLGTMAGVLLFPFWFWFCMRLGTAGVLGAKRHFDRLREKEVTTND